MSVEIEISTDVADKKLDDLGNKIVGLADKAKTASEGFKKNLDFSSGALAEIRAMAQAFDALDKTLKSFGGDSRAAADGIKQIIDTQTTLRQAMAQTSTTVIAQASAMKSVQAASKASAEAMKKDARDTADAVAANEKRQRDAYDTTTYAHKIAVAQRAQQWNQMVADQRAANAAIIAQARGDALKETEEYRQGYAARLAAAKKATAEALAAQKAAEAQNRAQIAGDLLRETEEYRQGYAARQAASKAALAAQAEAEKQIRAQIRAQAAGDLLKETEEYKQGLRAKQEAAKKAAADEVAALKTVENELRSTTSALDQYRAKVAALSSLRVANIGNSSAGINTAQFTAGLAAAKAEFNALNIAQARTSVGLRSFMSSSGLAAQGAASLRAAMQGAGLGFGIFTGATILAATAVYGTTKALRETITVGAEFEKTLRSATSVFAEIGQDRNSLQPYIDQFIKLSQTSKFSASEVAEAFKSLGQAGQTAQEALTTLPAVLNLATVGELSTEKAANKLVNTLAAFGLQATDAVSVSDKITAASLASTTTISELTQALGQVGATAHAAGIGLDETLASIALLRQVGISASKSGTDLRNIIQSLATQTPKAKAAMQALGVDMKAVWSGPGGTLNLIAAFKELQRVLSGLSPKDKLKAATDIFDRRSSGALLDFIKMLDGAGNSLDAYLSKVQNSSGATARIAAIINDNAVTAFAQLQHAMEGVAIQAFTQYSGELTDKLKELTSYINQNAPELAKELTSLMTALLQIADFFVRNLRTIAEFVGMFLAFKTATLVIRELAAGVMILEGAINAWKVAQEAATAANVAGAASTVAMGEAAAGTAVTAGSLATTVGRLAPLFVAAGLAGYEFGKYISDTNDEIEKSKEGFSDLLTETHKLQEVGKNLAAMTPEATIDYFNRLKNSISGLAEKYAEAKAEQDRLEQQKNAAVSLSNSLPNDADLAANAASAIVAWNEAKGKAVILSKEMAVNLAIESTALGQLIGQSAGATAALDGLSTSMSILSTFTSQFSAAAPGLSGFLNTLKNQINVMRGSADATRDAAAAAKKHTEEETNRAAAVEESKQRIRELTSELKNIIKAYGSEAGDVADLNRQLSQNNAIRQMIAAQGGKMTEMMRAIGVSGEEAMAALDWSDQQKTIDAVSAAIGRADPRYKDLTKSISDAGKATLDGNAAFEKASEMVERSTLSDEKKTQVLAVLKQAIDDVASGADKQAAKMRDFAVSTEAAWAAFNTTDDVAGRLAAFGNVFKNATDEVKNNITTDAELASVIKTLGTNYADSLQPAANFNDFLRAANDLAAKGTPIVGGWAKAIQTAYEKTPLGALEKQNKDLQTQIELTKQGGDQWEIYSTALQAVGGDASKLTPEIYAAAEATVKFKQELAQVQEVQNAFKGLVDGMAHAFADFTTGGIKNFSDFKSKIKDLFKQLLNDLVAMMFRNALFSFFGMGGGGNSGGFWSSIINGFAGMMGGGGGTGSLIGAGVSMIGGAQGSGQTFNLSDLSGSAAANYTGGVYAPGSGPGNSQSTGSSWLDWATNGSSMYNQYQNLGGLNGFWYGSGRTMPGSSYFGTGMYGPGMETSYAPSALGYGTAIAGGLYAGYNRYQNGYGGGWSAAGGLTYGIGTTALGLGLGSMAAGTGFAAGVGSMAAGGTAMGASAGVAAAIPVIGWIALAAMLVDMISGGKLFGTKGKVIGGASQLDVTGSGASVSQWYTTKGQKPLFGGAYYKEHQMAPDQAAQDAADDFYDAIKKGRDDLAKTFGVEMGDIVGGTFVQSFDKHGNPTTSTTTINGQTYKNETQEQFAAREQAENTTAVLQKVGVDITKYTHKFIQNADDYATAVQDSSAMLQTAFIDIKGNVGLFTGDNALQQTFDEVVKLKNADESLVDAYARIIGSVQLMDTTLGPMGASLNKTRLEFVEWSAELVNSLGGLQAAQQIMADFSDTFGVQFQTGRYAMDQADKRLKGLLSSIGLSVDTTADQFAAAFQKMLPNMTPQQAADWLRVAEAFSNLKKMKDALGDFMFGIEGQLADFTGRSYVHQLEEVKRQMEANIKQATALGASEEQLNEIRQLASYQIKQIIEQLTSATQDLVKQLYGSHAADNAHNAEMQRISEQDKAQQEMYNNAKDAIKSITDFLKGLQTGDLSPQNLQGRLQSAQEQFQQTLQAAMSGDPEAMQNLTQDAQTYLELAQQYYGSDANYAQIFDEVTSALREAQAAFQTIVDRGPGAGANGGAGGSGGSQTVQLTAGERFQLALQLAQNIGQLGIATGKDVQDLLKSFGVNINSLAHDLGIDINHWTDETGPNIKLMADSLGVTVPDLIMWLGGKADDIAAYYGVKADDIIAGNIEALKTMSDDLGISILDSLKLVGIPITDLLTGMGVDISTLTADTPAQLAALATSLNVSVLDLMGAAGISMTDLFTAWNGGVAITSLDPASMALLTQFANILGVEIVPLLTSMGFDITTIAHGITTTLQQGLDSLPDLPPDIRDAIAPYLTAINESGNNDELNTNTQNLVDYVNTLPQDVQDMLRPILEGVGIHITGGGAATLDTVDHSINDNTAVMQNVADNTGDNGPIAQRLDDIHTAIVGGGGYHPAGTGTPVTGGAQMEVGPESLTPNTEAMNAAMQSFFDYQFDASDLWEEQPTNTKSYRAEEEAVRTNQENAQNRNSNTATAAAVDTTAKLDKLHVAMTKLHKMLAERTGQIAHGQSEMTGEQKRARREMRLRRK